MRISKFVWVLLATYNIYNPQQGGATAPACANNSLAFNRFCLSFTWPLEASTCNDWDPWDGISQIPMSRNMHLTTEESDEYCVEETSQLTRPSFELLKQRAPFGFCLVTTPPAPQVAAKFVEGVEVDRWPVSYRAACSVDDGQNNGAL